MQFPMIISPSTPCSRPSFVSYFLLLPHQIFTSHQPLHSKSLLEELNGNISTYFSLLEARTNIHTLQQLHAHLLITGLVQNPFLGSKLINIYAKCGSSEDARKVFDKACERNILVWNAMIKEYTQKGFCEEALRLYYIMQKEDIQPDNFTFPYVLKACGSLLALQEGKWIHHHIVRSGHEGNVYVGNALIDMYAKCGSLENARDIFDKLTEPDVVSWTAMIAGYAQHGHVKEALELFHRMQTASVQPNPVTTLSIVSACRHLGHLQVGKSIHNYTIRRGFNTELPVGNCLIDMYVKCGGIDLARRMFDRMSGKNVVSWSTMIAGYTQNGHALEALELFSQMQEASVKPNSVTITSVLPACAQLGDLQRGKWIHDFAVRNGFESDISVRNSLVAMYAKCGSVENARQVFDKMSIRDVVSWSAMIAGYAQNGNDHKALVLFNQMQQAGVKPNSVTLLSVLSACAKLGALQQGKWVQDYVAENGMQFNISVQNSLVDMYAKCGEMEIACKVFEQISIRDVVSWNALISGYAQNGYASETLTLFHQMQLAGMMPDSVTMVSVLLACAHLGTLQQGKLIHDYVIKSGVESDVFVGTALIDMYTKCGDTHIGRQFFDKMSKRDLVSWNAMIAGYGMHGHGHDAVELFYQMQQTGVKPDHIIFICILSACSHAGLVDDGCQLFDCMSRDYSITPRVEHYACMVDLLGRAGCLHEAHDFIKRMPLQPDIRVWGALLGACRIHNNIELGERVAKQLFDLNTKDAGHYILLSNIYAAAGKWHDAAKVVTMMKDKGLKKTPGCSVIEVERKVHTFLSGDRSHPQSQKIYAMLEILAKQMKTAGYVPNMNEVLHDVEEKVKEHILYSHSEKLAIAFGLINTSPGTTIQITKNLRVCGDCHSATKFISKIVRRKIIVRDTYRFHQFKDGLCSCGDYW